MMYVCLQNTLKLFIFTIIRTKLQETKYYKFVSTICHQNECNCIIIISPFCIHKNKIISKRHFLNHISISVLSTEKINLFCTLPIQYVMYQFIFYICVNQFSCTFYQLYNHFICYVQYIRISFSQIQWCLSKECSQVQQQNTSQIIQKKKKEESYHSSASVTTQEEYFLCYVIREVHSKGNVLMKKALTFDLI